MRVSTFLTIPEGHKFILHGNRWDFKKNQSSGLLFNEGTGVTPASILTGTWWLRLKCISLKRRLSHSSELGLTPLLNFISVLSMVALKSLTYVF